MVETETKKYNIRCFNEIFAAVKLVKLCPIHFIHEQLDKNFTQLPICDPPHKLVYRKNAKNRFCKLVLIIKHDEQDSSYFCLPVNDQLNDPQCASYRLTSQSLNLKMNLIKILNSTEV